MKQRKADSSKMRVAVISASRNQRDQLKRLIEEYGPKVVGASGFRDYNATIGAQKPDVLLIDLDQADDAALDRLERLVEQSKIPILFNESTAIPMTPGPYRDDWLDNLVGKLFNLAQKKDVVATSSLLNRPRYSNTSARHALAKVLVVSHSKTRRRVLQIILASQSIKDTAETNYGAAFRPVALKAYDLLLLDEHNVGPEDAVVFDQLLAQSEIPVKLCNSSHIPQAASDRTLWGIQLAGQLIKLAKTSTEKAATDSAHQIPVAKKPGDRIAQLPTGVRATTTLSSSQKETTTAVTPVSANQEESRKFTRRIKAADGQASSMLRGIEPQKDRKYRPPKSPSALEVRETNAVKAEPLPPSVTATVAKIEIDAPQDRGSENRPRANNTKSVFDADTIRILADDDTWAKSIAALTQEERDAEIARFFNFNTDTETEAPSASSKAPAQKLKTGKPTATTNRLKPIHKQQATNPFANKKTMTGESIKKWFQSLAGIRQKLPKLFH